MGKYAVVEIAGKQYKVQEGGEVVVDKLPQDDGAVSFDKVLLVNEDGQIKVGVPYVAGASVSAKVLAQEKGEKIYVVKFKAKSRYRRRTGFRAQQTRIRIEKLLTGSKKREKISSDINQ